MECTRARSGCVRILQRGIVPEAVVAANDVTAAGVLRVLEQRGLRVPEDVALIGYDDALFAMGMSPPLTTVHQPIRLLGEKSVDALFERLQGMGSLRPLTVASYGVIRRSCGCDPACTLPDLGPERRQGVSSFPSSSNRHLDPNLQPTHARIRELLERILRDASTPGSAEFRRGFAQILSDLIRNDGGLLPWQDGISKLRHLVDTEVTDPRVRPQAFSIVDEARILLTEAVQRAAVRAQTRTGVKIHDLYGATTLLAGEPDFAAVAARIEDAVPRLLSRACHIVLLDHETGGGKLRFSMTEGVRADLPDDGIPFDLAKLLPDGVPFSPAPSFLIVQLLKHGTERFGLMMFEGVPEDGFAYLALTNQVASSLKRFEREQEIERLHSAEKARARELELSYRLLQTNHDKLVAAEKMASIGRLTAGIAHEMNTPIGAVRGALAELERLVEEYRQSMGTSEVTLEDHRAIADDMEHAIAIAKSAASRTATFVRHIREQTRDMGDRDYRTFDAVAAVRETLLLLDHEIQATGCTVSLVVSQPTINLYGPPSRFAQVFVNLVANAIDASKMKGGGPIQVELSARTQGARLVVRDQGIGITKEDEHRIFDQMFTTKPFGEGTGLSLALAHEIVKSDFAGTIEFESEPGRGSAFTITFCNAKKSNSDELRPPSTEERGGLVDGGERAAAARAAAAGEGACARLDGEVAEGADRDVGGVASEAAKQQAGASSDSAK